MSDQSSSPQAIRFWSFASSRAVHLFAAASIGALVIAAVLGAAGLPFDRPSIATRDMLPNLVVQVVQIPLALAIVALAYFITRGRAAVDFDARTPEAVTAKRETIGLLAYGCVVLVVGHLLGVGMHLHGSIFGPTHEVTPSDVYAWAAYNFLLLAVVPYVVFRRHGSDHRAMCLKSDNLANDALLVMAVLILESVAELTTFHGLLSLGPTQLLVGMPLTLVLHLLGTGLPVMIFVYALLFPRYVKLTASRSAAVVLGALTYAGLHTFEYWTVYDSPTNAILSVAFVFLQFAFPGLIKSFLTLRTGNAWVHLWAYHAIAPHVTVDTPLVVQTFGIK